MDHLKKYPLLRILLLALLITCLPILVAACSGDGTVTSTSPAEDPTQLVSTSASEVRITESNLTTGPKQSLQTPSATADLVIATQPTIVNQPMETPNSASGDTIMNAIWGIEMHNISNDGGLRPVADAGTDWIRRNALFWSDVEPQKGARNWDAIKDLEQEMINASAQGLELILVVRRTPSWAQEIPGKYCGPIKPDEIGAFADFMGDVVARYSIPPYNVKYWELGNEPDVDPSLVGDDNIFGCWGYMSDPFYGGGDYASVLEQVYPAVKAANPAAQLLIGGLLMDCDPNNPPEIPAGSGEYKDCTPSRYLEGILSAGGGNYFDGVSFHAYDLYFGELGEYGNPNWNSSWDSSGPALSAKSLYIHYLLSKYGYQDKYLINSEVALICGSTGQEPVCLTEEFELTKAYYAAQIYPTAIAEGLRANIWYSIKGWRSSGLVTSEMYTLPVYDAYMFSAEQLAGVQLVGSLDFDSMLTGYEFRREGGRVWIVWSRDKYQHRLQLPSEPDAVYDVFGSPLPVSIYVDVTLMPIYIEFSQ